MKKKILVLAPLMALVLTGCFSRTPTNEKKKSSSTTTAQTSTSGGSTTSGGSSGTSGGTSGGTSSGTSGTSGTSGSSGTSSTSEVPPVPTEVTVEEAYNAAVTAGSSGTSEALTFSGTVIATLGDQYYVQDGSYAMYCRPKSDQAVTGLAVNKKVKTTAKVGTYSNLVETINNGYVSGAVTGDATAPNPTTVTSLTQLQSLKHNVAVNVEATLASKGSGTWSSTSYVRPTIKIGSDTTAITITLEKGTAYKKEYGDIFSEAAVGDKLTFTNVIRSQFNDNAQLTFVDQSVLSKNTVDPTSVTITSGSSVTVGSTLNLTATVGPTGASQNVTWSIVSGSEYASLSGTNNSVLTGNAAGSVVVKATATGTSVSDTKTITVNPQVLTKLEFKEETYSLQAGDKDMSTEINFAPSTASKTLSFSIVETGKHSSITSAGVLTVSGEDTTFTVKVSDSVSSLNDTCTVNVVSEKVLSSISLDTSSAQKEFDVDDTFNYEGLVVTAHYSDSTSEKVTPTNVSTPDMTSAGEKTVTVSYTEEGVTKTAEYTITVNDPTPVVTSSTYSFQNTKNSIEVTDTSTIYGWFKTSGTSIISSVASPSKVYPGANGGSAGTAWTLDNALKLGTAKAGGSLTLNLSTGVTVSKIVVTGYGWKNSSSPALVLTIGSVSSSSDPLPYTNKANVEGGLAGTVDFEFPTALTGTVTISTGSTAVLITSLEIFYSN